MQKEIRLTDKTLLVVGLPKEAKEIFIHSDMLCLGDLPKNIESHYVRLPKGDWQLLGIYPELTEEQTNVIMENEKIGSGVFFLGYINFLDGLAYFDRALESFQSLMEREKCYTVNPFGDYFADLAYGGDTHTPTFEQWKEAESRTFSKYAILIKSK